MIIKVNKYLLHGEEVEYGTHWVVHYKPSSRKRVAEPVPTDKLLGEIFLTNKDLWNCATIRINLYDDFEESDLRVLLEGTFENFRQNMGIVFLRCKDEYDGVLGKVLQSLEFKKDPMDDSYCISEAPITSWIPIYMCLGVGCGVALGNAGNVGMPVGICIGLSVGVAMGAALEHSARKSREMLIAARLAGIEPKEYKTAKKGK